MRRDRFGLRIAEPHPATLRGDITRRLRDCAAGPDTAAARTAVAEALAGRWWEHREMAIQAIGQWRTEADHAWLVQRARRPLPDKAEVWRTPRGHELRWREMEIRVARHVLFSRPPRAEDVGWLLDLWFTEPQPHGIRASWFGWASETSLRARIAVEIESGDSRRLQRAIWLLYESFLIANRAEILGHLAASGDEAAAKLATRLLGWLDGRRRQNPPKPAPVPHPPRPVRSRPPRLHRPPH